ncbi:hypothetical protein AEM51_14150 [Bacteroidetes bacterium UKL13-3]|jgi:hypothetical protein|nr:hypothetical protein AEM51_14150 [Bacteroidetes bacterium UKL13-3]HCP94577.1 hypothetical protein [Bacteroidota bacterium]
MNRNVALGISGLFHPVFVNLFGLLAIVFLSPYLSLGLTPNAKFFYIAFMFVTAGVLPILAVLVMRLLGKVQSVLLDVQDERNIPYLITASVYLFDYYFLSRMHTPSMLRAYILACACIVVAVVIINHFYKISVHGASLGALTAIILTLAQAPLFDLRYVLLLTFILSGITLSARLFLHAHTFGQVISGWMLGFVIMYLIL